MHLPRTPSFRRALRVRVLAVAGSAVAALAAGAVAAGPSGAATGALLWRGDYETGGLSQFDATPWNNLPAAPRVVRSPVAGGRYAGRYVIPAGGSRSESVPKLRGFGEGDDLWFGFSTRLGTRFPLRVPNWQVIAQWKNDGIGSPPLSLKITSGVFQLDGGYGWPGNTDAVRPKEHTVALGRARTGVWDRWVWHIRFSSSARTNRVDVWRNGRPVATDVHMPGGTLYPRLGSYLKLGYYRDPAIRIPGTVYHDRWKVGRTRASVA